MKTLIRTLINLDKHLISTFVLMSKGTFIVIKTPIPAVLTLKHTYQTQN